jgi:predicted molibdopterin-dependent oxidoreductase YjgC
MRHVIFNNKKVEFTENQTLLDTASVAGINIPTLCQGDTCYCSSSCGLGIAENVDTGELISTCTTLATEGMNITTESTKVFEARREKLISIFSKGAHNCFTARLPEGKCAPGHLEARELEWHEQECPAKGTCTLQKLAGKHKVPVMDIPLKIETPVVDNRSPFIARDYSRCIKCGQCISVCQDIGQNAISRCSYNGTWHPTVDIEKCTHCGQCLEACPVGALFDKKAFGIAKKKVTKVQTTCPYCGTGCQLQLHVKDEKIIKVTADEDVAPNMGRLCVKGRFGYDFIYSENRFKTPLIKEDGKFREASWDEALDLVASKFMEVRDEYGPDAIAGLSCARSITEDSYNMQKLFRATIGTNNIDHCART